MKRVLRKNYYILVRLTEYGVMLTFMALWLFIGRPQLNLGTPFPPNVEKTYAVGEVITPDGAGTYQEWDVTGAATHYGALTDGSSSTYISTGVDEEMDTETLTNPGTTAFVQQVDVTMTCKAPSGGGAAEKAATFIREGSTDTEGTAVTIDRTTFTEYTTSYTTNPRTSAAWTISQLNGLEGGVRLKTIGSGETVQCSEFNATLQGNANAKMSSYRWFTNANSTDVGAALAAQDTAYTLTSDGQAFRLRLTMHVTASASQLAQNSEPMTLQFAQKSGTCDTAYSGESWSDVTAATVIAFNDNATPADGATLTVNANDPSDGHTKTTETYEELNNFQNTVATVANNEDGLWDFSLKDNGATDGVAYCFRVIKSDDNLPSVPSVVPEIQIFNSDTTPPTITNVSSDHANGSFTTGEVIDIDVTFSEAVTSTGNVTVELETGVTDQTCTFTVTAATTGTCNYTVQAGDTSSDLTVKTFSGTIKDAALNAMTDFVPATNLAANKAIVIDTTAPTISSTAPVTNASINDIATASDVNYTLSEIVTSGTIVMTRTSGTADGSSPHTCTLTLDGRTSGAHTAFDMTDTDVGCTEAQSLIDGAVYTFDFNATDKAGNAATQVSNTGVTFDTTAPTISSTAPATGATINSITSSSDVSYTLSEAIASGSIVMTRTSGTADGSSPHTCTLKGTALNTGAHSNIDMSDTTNGCTSAQSLVSGTVYTFAFDATDAAGNAATQVSNTSVTFDNTAPTVSTLSPADNATGVSTTTNLIMTFSETVNVNTGNVVIKKTSDNSTVETIDITSGQVTGTGTDTITVNPSVTLADGTEYYVQVDAGALRDAAQNNYAGIADTTSWSFTTVAVAGGYAASGSLISSSIDTTSYPTIKNQNLLRATWTQSIPSGCTLTVSFRGTNAGGATPDYTGVSWEGPYSGSGTTVTQNLAGVANLQGKRYFQYKVDMTNCNSSLSTPEFLDIQLEFD
ncbi:MAG: Ig-like domain-containing protein [Candidatus Komeilibacteria bacterium]|nr:Ig-like domain-containing protein [Candidatus Komeilibacteria bacterium]